MFFSSHSPKRLIFFKTDLQAGMLIKEGMLLVKANTNPGVIADRLSTRLAPKARAELAAAQNQPRWGVVVEEVSRTMKKRPKMNYVTAPPAIEFDEIDCPSLAPAWMATFSDLGTLIMAFFVLILAQSVIDSPRAEEVSSRCGWHLEWNASCPS